MNFDLNLLYYVMNFDLNFNDIITRNALIFHVVIN